MSSTLCYDTEVLYGRLSASCYGKSLHEAAASLSAGEPRRRGYESASHSIAFGKRCGLFSYPVRCGSLCLAHTDATAQCVLCFMCTFLRHSASSSPNGTLPHNGGKGRQRLGAGGKGQRQGATTYSALETLAVTHKRCRAAGGCCHRNEGKILFPSTLLF